MECTETVYERELSISPSEMYNYFLQVPSQAHTSYCNDTYGPAIAYVHTQYHSPLSVMYCVTMETHVLLYTHLHEYTVSCATILRWVMLQWQQHTVHVVLCIYAHMLGVST